MHPKKSLLPRTALIATAAALLSPLCAAPDTPDPTFTTNAGTFYDAPAIGGVSSVLVQRDGKILVGSNEMPLTAGIPPLQVSLVRFNPDGTVDSTFFADTETTGSDQGIYYDLPGWPEVHALGLQSDQKIIAAGVMHGFRLGSEIAPTLEFKSNSILRFNADGTIDATFQTNGTQASSGLNYIEDVTVDASDRILCAGGFGGFRNSTSDPYTTRYGLARLNANGSLDTSFQIDPHALGVPNGSSPIYGFFHRAITDSSGKIYVSGELSWGFGFPRPSVKVFARLFSDGSVDPSFAPSLTDIGDFVIEPNGKITATGSDNSAPFFKRFNTDGSVDSAFNFPGGFAKIAARPLRRSPAGQYLLAVPHLLNQDKLIRVNSNGSIDSSFAPVTTDNVAGDPGYFGTWDIAPNGKIYSGSGKQFTQGVETHKLVAFEGDYIAASPGTINLALGSATVVESNGSFYAAITRTGGDTGAASVTLNTSNGSASAGSDYTTVSTVVSWAAGESGTKYVAIPITNDGVQESSENFNIALSAVSGATLGGSSSGVVTILDVDSPPSIVTQPQSQSINAVQTANFSVAVQSNSSVAYQWRLNGSNITGATSPNYTTPPLAQSDNGNSYDVVITSPAGSLTSSAAIVTVASPDGTPSPAWTSPSSINAANRNQVVALPDGTSYVIHEAFGQPPVIKRFLADGSEDNAYVSPAFTQGGNNGNLFSIAVTADGKIYVRGIFDAVGGTARSGLARLNADGTHDTTFSPNFHATHSITGDIVHPTAHGLYLVLQPNGQARGLARLTDAGAIDTNFKFSNASFQNTFSHARVVRALDDGKVLIGYYRGNGISITSYGFARLEADGDVDTTFNEISSTSGLTGFNPHSIILRPDGSFYYSTNSVIAIANADGTADASFNLTSIPNGSINSIALVKGKVIAAGAFTEINGTPVGRIARFESDGSLDASFPGGPGANDIINHLFAPADGSLLVGGNFQTFNTAPYSALVKLLMDSPAVEIFATPVWENDGTATLTLRRLGSTDTAISVDLNTQSGSATEGSDFSATSTTVAWAAGDAADKTAVITLLDDGDAEGTETFFANLTNSQGTALVNTSATVTIRDDEALPVIASQPIAASALTNGSSTFSVSATNGLALTYQWFFNGTAISGATTNSLTINPVTGADEGSYHVVVSTVHESVTSSMVDLTIVADPTLISSLYTSPATSAASGNILIVTAAPDGGAYIGGTFLNFGGNAAFNYIAKINEDGSVDTNFTPPALGGIVNDIVVSQAGDVFVVGNFTGSIVKLASDGTEDAIFTTNRGTGGNYQANTVGVFPDGTIAVGGDFRTWNGTTIAAFNQQNSHLVRLNADGTLTTTRYANPGNNNHYNLDVDAMRVFADGRVMVAYNLTTSAYAKARLYNTDGSEVISFVYPFNSRRVDHITQFPDGSFLFSGDNSLYKVSATGSVTATYDTASDWFSSAVQIDGKVISSRNFTSSRVRRFLATQQEDPIYNTGTKFNNNVYSLALRNDGRLWAAGNFTQYDGTTYPGIVLLENQPIALAITGQPQDLVQDPATTAAFTCDATGTTAISYQWRKNGTPLSDGGDISGSTSMTLSIANIEEADEGDYTCLVTNASGSETSETAKLFVLGAPEVITLSPDATIIEGHSIDFTVETIGAGVISYQWQKDGSDITGETAATLSVSPAGIVDAGSYRVVITNSQGSLTSDPIVLTVQPNEAAQHPDFTPLATGAGFIETILELPNGNILVGGTFSSLSDGSNTSGSRLALVSPTGAILSTSTLSANATVHKLSLQADGKILVAGNFTNINGASRPRAARLNSDLTLDTSFTPPTTGTFGAARDIAEDANGKVVVCGEFGDWNGLTDTAYMIRFNSDGTHDTAFKSLANSWTLSIIPQADGSYFIAGRLTDYGSNTSADGLTKINNDGTLDASLLFNPGFFYADEVFQTSTGHLILLNEFQSPIRKYDSSATLENSFWTNFNANGGSRTVAEEASGKLLIGGRFTTVAGVSIPRLVRINPDGTTDSTFDVGTGFNNDVKSVLIASDGSIWAGGSFTDYNGTTAPNLIRLKGAPSATPYQQWIANTTLSGADAEFDADPDGDGMKNGFEFLYGMDPTVPEASAVWSPSSGTNTGAALNAIDNSVGLDPAKHYVFVYLRTPLDTKGLTPELESSTNLTGFNATNVHALGAPTDDGVFKTQLYCITTAVEDTTKLFWRMKVSE